MSRTRSAFSASPSKSIAPEIAFSSVKVLTNPLSAPATAGTPSLLVPGNAVRNSVSISAPPGRAGIMVSDNPAFSPGSFEIIQPGTTAVISGWTGPVYIQPLMDSPTILFQES